MAIDKIIGTDAILTEDSFGVQMAIDLTQTSICCGAEIIHDHICRNCHSIAEPMSNLKHSEIDRDLDCFYVD